MPNLNDIQQQVLREKSAAQDVVRQRFLKRLVNYTKRDTILYASAFTSNKGAEVPQAALSVSAEDMQGFMASLHGLRGKQLDLILHSPGGSMEAADQIVQYLRSKYEHIRAIVPQSAMSAATMIACACDEIVMGKHSAIGPIDPQVTFPTQSGRFTAPAQSILDEFEMAKREIKADPSSAPLWATKIQAFPPGFLTLCATTLSLAESKVAEWLDKYMFSQASHKSGAEIAKWLANANEHKTHGRPIGAQRAFDAGLKVYSLKTIRTYRNASCQSFTPPWSPSKLLPA
jgi:ATP-dependent protease ClpP protease subunit